MAPIEEKKETTEDQLTRLETKLVYMRAELDGMDAREAKRKQTKKELTAFMLGFTYALLLVYVIMRDK